MSSAGYSDTPLSKKLGIRAGTRVGLAAAPAGFHRTVEAMPAGPVIVGPRARCDLVLLFCERASRLASAFRTQARRLPPDGALWVAWPKKSSGRPTDLSFDVVRSTGLASGLVDVKVCAIDATWSGLKFVVRVVDRPKVKRPARKA